MYQINLGDKILYYPGSEDAAIYDTDMEEEVGAAGEFQFKVPASNPIYSDLTMGSLVTILKNGKEFWRGEIRDIRIDFNKVADVYVLEDLAWLADEYLPPAKITNQTYTQRLTAVINSYNTNRPAERQFEVGYISNVVATNICNWKTEYEWSILESIRRCIGKDDGYVRVRRQYVNGVIKRYIDVVPLSGYGVAATQPIEYGYNLLDYVKESDYGNLTNVLTPYGDTLDDDSEVYEDYSTRLQGNTITNSDSVTAYGRHAKAVVFDGVTNVNTLNNLAAAYLSRYCQPQLTMEVSAVDLAEIEDADSINLGDSVRIIAKPFAIDQRLYLTRISRDLQCLDKNKITLSGHVSRRTLSSQIIEAMDAIEEMPEESNILKAAKKNALNMLLDETQQGYVVYEYDANNKYIVAINICNARTIDASTKRWRWSQTGFGYMERDNTSSEWSRADAKIAITMAGEIVADFITTGSMYATRIRGGTLSLGGSGNGQYKNGSLYMYSENDQEIGHWDRDGITILVGSIKLTKQNMTDANNGLYLGSDGIALGANSKFKVSSAGKLECSDITITGGSIKLTKQNMTDANNGLYLGSDGIALGANSKFKVSSAGKVTATDIDISGKVDATEGTIGAHGTPGNRWQIGSTSIYNGCSSIDGANNGTYVGTDGIRNKNGTKHVTIQNGKITANDADIKGTIKADSGNIGDFNIDNGSLSVDDALVSKDKIGCGKAGKGIVNIVGGKGGSGREKYGYILIGNDGTPDNVKDGLILYGNGVLRHFDGSGNEDWYIDLSTLASS